VSIERSQASLFSVSLRVFLVERRQTQPELLVVHPPRFPGPEIMPFHGPDAMTSHVAHRRIARNMPQLLAIDVIVH
jgi:hypothetical protein